MTPSGKPTIWPWIIYSISWYLVFLPITWEYWYLSWEIALSIEILYKAYVTERSHWFIMMTLMMMVMVVVMVKMIAIIIIKQPLPVHSILYWLLHWEFYTCFILYSNPEISTIVFYILQITELRFRKVNCPLTGHTIRGWPEVYI